MKVIQQNHRIIGYCPTEITAAKKHIEAMGRICWQSWGKLTETSYIKFVNDIMKKKHKAVIEMSNLVVRCQMEDWLGSSDEHRKDIESNYKEMFYRKIDSNFFYPLAKDGYFYVAGNYRAWLEGLFPNINFTEFPDDIFTLVVDTLSLSHDLDMEVVTDINEIPYELRAVTVVFVTSRNNTHEIVRHRPCSYLQLSQRYVKSDEGIFVIEPADLRGKNPDEDEAYKVWLKNCNSTETDYRRLRELDKSPQEARSVLTNCCSTEIAVNAYMPEWEIIRGLRTGSPADPNMRDLMIPMFEQMENLNYIRPEVQVINE